MTKDSSDILEQAYEGPSRLVSASALGTIESSVASMIGLPLGVAIGNLQAAPINKFLDKYEIIKKGTEDLSGIFGKSFENKIKKSKNGKAMLFSGIVTSFVGLPVPAFIHGTWVGYHNADKGLNQFHRAQNEIKQLRDEVDRSASGKATLDG